MIINIEGIITTETYFKMEEKQVLSTIRVIPPQLLEFATTAYANHDSAHNLNHALRVFDNACRIIEDEKLILTEGQLKMLPYVMIGHDFRDHKIVSRGLGLPEETIEDFFKKNLGSKMAEEVMCIHKNCSWSKRNDVPEDIKRSMLFMIMQDADWLDALGEIGLSRCIEFTRILPKISEVDIPKIVSEHIHEKLLLMPDEFNFHTSRLLARKATEPLISYLKTV